MSAKSYILLVIASLIAVYAKGRVISNDSLAYRPSGFARFARSSIGNATFTGVPLILMGQVAKHDDDKFRKSLNGYLPVPEHAHDYYLQLTPAAVMLGMKALGVKGESSWAEMLVADAGALAIMCTTVEGLKHITTEYRPDGSDEHSFPSGHTATAFMTATMLHHEYGARYPWLSVAGYGAATTTAFLRVHDNRHWMGDVLTGAGIGIISTELGYVLSDLIFHKPILKDADYFSSTDYEQRPSFISYYVSYDHSGRDYKWMGSRTARLSSGGSIGLEGAWFASPYVGVGARASYSDFKYYVDDVPQAVPLHYVTALAGVYLSCPLTQRVSSGVKAQAGYGRFDATDINKADGTADVHLAAHGGFAFSYGAWVSIRTSGALEYRIFIDNDRLPKQHKDSDHLSPVSIGAQVAVNF